MKQILALVMSLLIGIATMTAQTEVKGKVVDSAGEPLQGSTILFMQADTIAGGMISNEKGRFEIKGLPEGEYECNVSLLGYKSQSRKVKVAGKLDLPKFVMEEDSRMLGEVSVSADVRDHVIVKAGMETYFLSDRAKGSKTAYEALREIPRLIVNPVNNSISMDDGRAPLILIDGVKRPGYMSVLDPSLIESVEVVDNPSARYRGDGASAVLNVKLKRKGIQPYLRGNIGGNVAPTMKYMYASGSLEAGTSESSLYANVTNYGLYNNNRETYSDTYSGNLHRELYGKEKFSMYNWYFNLGGDNILSDKHYISYNARYISSPTKTDGTSTGTMSEYTAGGIEESDMVQRFNEKGDFQSLAANMYYKFTPNKRRTLELEGNYTYGFSGSKGSRSQLSEIYEYQKRIDLDNSRNSGKLNAHYSDRVNDGNTFQLGSNTEYSSTNIDDKLDEWPVYGYKQWREYVYAGFDNNRSSGRFNYLLSVGADMVFANADGSKNHYITLLPSVSLSYSLNKGNRNKVSLEYSRSRQMPDASQLNPRNVSTDSINVIVGNPKLTPAMTDRLKLGFSLGFGKLRIIPYAEYRYISDKIMPIDRMEGNVRINTYDNFGHQNLIQTGASANYNLPFGNIMARAYYQKEYIKGMPFSGDGFDAMINFNFWYKKVSGMVYYELFPKAYTLTSKSNASCFNSLSVSWNINSAWSVSLYGENLFNVKQRIRGWTESNGYKEYHTDWNKSISPKITIGVWFNFQNKAKWSWRQKKEFYNDDKALEDVKVK